MLNCNKEQECIDKDCNTCKENKEVLGNIAIIRTALKFYRLIVVNKPEIRAKVERALKWVDNYIV